MLAVRVFYYVPKIINLERINKKLRVLSQSAGVIWREKLSKVMTSFFTP